MSAASFTLYLAIAVICSCIHALNTPLLSWGSIGNNVPTQKGRDKVTHGIKLSLLLYLLEWENSFFYNGSIGSLIMNRWYCLDEIFNEFILSSIKEILFQSSCVWVWILYCGWVTNFFLYCASSQILVFIVWYEVKHVLITQWVCFNFILVSKLHL